MAVACGGTRDIHSADVRGKREKGGMVSGRGVRWG